MWYLCGKCSFVTIVFNKVDDIMSKSMLHHVHACMQRNVFESGKKLAIVEKNEDRDKHKSIPFQLFPFFWKFFYVIIFVPGRTCSMTWFDIYLYRNCLMYLCLIALVVRCFFFSRCVCVLSACMRLRQKLKDDILTRASYSSAPCLSLIFSGLFVCLIVCSPLYWRMNMYCVFRARIQMNT